MKQLFFFIFSLTLIFTTKTYSQDDTTSLQFNLDEITITAPKENPLIYKVPATVSIISSKQLTNNEIVSLKDLSSITPNFFMPDYGTKITSPIYIRGIGSRRESPSVGLYIDNVPYFEKSNFDFDFFDIESIEVLKGPQGTLYGRNTMGGIINITTRSPLNYKGTRLMGSLGKYGAYKGQLSHYDKIGENLGYSLALNYSQFGGFWTNEYTEKSTSNQASYGLRNKLAWKLKNNLIVENIFNYEQSKQDGSPYVLLNDSINPDNDINYNEKSLYEREILSNALHIKYIGNKINILATTGFQYIEDKSDVDQDFTPDSLYFVQQAQKQDMFTQEFIIKSNNSEQYEWVAGAFGFFQNRDNDIDVDIYKYKMRTLKYYSFTNSGIAFFAQFRANNLEVENLDVILGWRIDAEKDILDYKYDRQMSEKLSTLEDTIYPSLSFLAISPKIALMYSFYEKSSVYATITQSYKAGGFNTSAITEEELIYEPETSINYEIGSKTTLLKDRFYADFALFYIDWQNQHIAQPPESGIGSIITNAGKSESKGAEFTLKLMNKNAKLFMNYGYTDARFLAYKKDSATDYTGNYIPYTPKHTFSVQLNQTIPLKTTLIDAINLNILYRLNGKHYWNENNEFYQNKYSLLDAKFSVIKKQVQIDFWAKNILNTSYDAFMFSITNPTMDNNYFQKGKPLHFGVNLVVEF